MADDIRPKAEIRRFDVFAEFNRLKALSEGRPEDEAKGHGLWLAKVVAARRFAPARAGKPGEGVARSAERQPAEEDATAPEEWQKFRSLGDEPQTDELYDREIVQRMGEDFYREVFAPAIAERFHQGDRYESLRDTVRKGWNEKM